MSRLRILALCVLGWLPLAAAAESYLLMAEEDGCIWCARWDAEVSQIYPLTPEGRAAPLRRYDVRANPPESVDFASRVRFTPTFVLVKDGVEVGRIEGYPGEDFFWALLGEMLRRADIELVENGT